MATFAPMDSQTLPLHASGNTDLNKSLSATKSREASAAARANEQAEADKKHREAKARRKKERAARKQKEEEDRIEKTLAEFDAKKKAKSTQRQQYLRNKIDLGHKIRSKRKELEAAKHKEAMQHFEEKFEARWKMAEEVQAERIEKEKVEREESKAMQDDDMDTPLKRALLRANQFSSMANNARILAQQNQLEFQRNSTFADVTVHAMARNKGRTTFGDEDDEDTGIEDTDPFAVAARAEAAAAAKAPGPKPRQRRRPRPRRKKKDTTKVAEVHPGLTLHAYALDLSEEDEAVARQNRLVADERLREMLKKKSESAQYHRTAHMAANARVRKAVILERFGRNPPIDIQISAHAEDYEQFVTYPSEAANLKRQSTALGDTIDGEASGDDGSHLDATTAVATSPGAETGGEGEAPHSPASYAVSEDIGEPDSPMDAPEKSDEGEGGPGEASPQRAEGDQGDGSDQGGDGDSEAERVPSPHATDATATEGGAQPQSEVPAVDGEKGTSDEDAEPTATSPAPEAAKPVSKPVTPEERQSRSVSIAEDDGRDPRDTLPSPRSPSATMPAGYATLPAIGDGSVIRSAAAGGNTRPQPALSQTQPLPSRPAAHSTGAPEQSREIEMIRRRRNRRRAFPKQDVAPLSFNQIQDSYPSRESTVNALGLRLPSLMASLSDVKQKRPFAVTTQF